MKYYKTGLLIAGLSGCLMAHAATPSMSWKVSTTQPLNEITFGLQINAAAPKDEFYFANQFGFTGGGGIGYTGIQPTVNTPDGKSQFMVLFSSFRKDSIARNENCKGGADGSPSGVTCRKYVPGAPGDTFLFDVKKEGNLMTGTAINQTTGRKDIIGQWEVGDSAGSLAGSQVSWIENYKMNSSSFKLTCDNKGWPYYEVKFLTPVGNGGTAAGSISGLNHGSDSYPGAITWTTDSSGTLVKGGYK